jgi:Protein of unknown function (DUF1588)/Protein of unknown function (DUF1592)/Protein of unknown function (DUF1585)
MKIWGLLAFFVMCGCEGVIAGSRSASPTLDASGGTGGGNSGSGGNSAEDASPFACRPSEVAPASAVQRLTDKQYANALRSALSALSATELQNFWKQTDVAQALASIPKDGTPGHRLAYDAEDQRISSLLVEPQLNLAIAAGVFVASDATRLERFVKSYAPTACAASVLATTCVEAFVSGFGRQVLRRPLNTDDKTFYKAPYVDATYGGYKAVIASILASPDFVFRTEFEGADVGPNRVTLTPFERAQRLAWTLTNAPPDATLTTAADARFQSAGHSYADEVQRLIKTPAARENFENFYRQWLRLERVPGFNPSAKSVLSLAYPDGSSAPIPDSVDLAQLRLNAFQELVDVMSFHTFDRDGTLGDALTSNVSLAKTADLAQLYGVSAWPGPRPDGSIDEGTLVKFKPGERAGLFTRAGFLISGFPDSNPILRGARLRTEFLCDEISPPADTRPPANYVAPLVPSTRNLTVAKTEIAGTSCRSCHNSLINPLGFPLEKYDSFGRYRTQEPLYSSTGSITGWNPVESTSTPNVGLASDSTVAADGVSLSKLLADSKRFQGCFSRHVFRYAYGRKEQLANGPDSDEPADACELKALQEAAGKNPLRNFLGDLVSSPRFQERTYGAEN